MKEVEKRALELFREHFGQPEAMKAIAASGSGRRYYRIAGKNRSERTVDRQKADALRDTVTALLAMREEWRHANCAGDRTSPI